MGSRRAEHQRVENVLPVKTNIQDRVCWAKGCSKRVLPATRGYRKWCTEHRKEARDAAMAAANERWRKAQGRQVGVRNSKKKAKTAGRTRRDK